MKFVAALLATSAAALTSSRVKYVQYVAEHNKIFLTQEEFEARHAIFAENDAIIEEHNSSNSTFTLGHNKFSDMSEEEKASYRGRLPQNNTIKRFGRSFANDAVPESVDWRELGGVNAIRDQGQCGSCWAFGSVAALEGAHFVATGTLSSFSEQQLVDCAFVKYGNFGCNGGLQERAYSYYEDGNKAIARDDYPYTASKGTCQYDSLSNTGVDVSTYTNVTPQSAAETKAALAQQPLTVSIEADKAVFQLYKSGVFDSAKCGTTLDHAVALVGYGSDAGQEYYILRNSWGTTWGEEGYMRIAIDGDGLGVCGVQSDPLYPSSN